MTAYGLSELAGKLSSVRFGCPKLLRCLEFQNLPRKNSFRDNFLQHPVGMGRAKVVGSSQAVGEYMCSRRISEWAEGWLTAERCVRGDRPFNRNGIMLGGGLRYQW
jgi:hypothetical protein